MKRIGVLTGGGDAPGLNSAIKSVVYRAENRGIETIAIHEGWKGLFDENIEDHLRLEYTIVRTWDRTGGTNIGTSRTNPFSVERDGTIVDRSNEIVRNLETLKLDGLVVMGGDDTLGVAAALAKRGFPVVGIPKTIDLDLLGTDYTLGFDTAVKNLTDMISRCRSSAGSHHWVQVIEAMGRHAGHLAFWSGVAGGATIILIPEVRFSFDRMKEKILDRLEQGAKDRRYPKYALIVASEGAIPEEGGMILASGEKDAFGNVKLGGIGDAICRWVQKETPYPARALVPAHLQRGGDPTPVDRIMGTLFGSAAVDLLAGGGSGRMVSAKGNAPACTIGDEDLEAVTKGIHLLDADRLYDPERLAMNRGFFGDTFGR